MKLSDDGQILALKNTISLPQFKDFMSSMPYIKELDIIELKSGDK